MICDANDDLGCVDNMFSMLGANVDDYASLGYFRGYDLSVDPYCVCLGDLPKKITWTTFLLLPMIFLRSLIRLRGCLMSLERFWLLPLTFYFLNCGPRSLISSCVL